MARGYKVLLVHDAHATYDLADIDHNVVSRVTEHALGDQVSVVEANDVGFSRNEPSTEI